MERGYNKDDKLSLFEFEIPSIANTLVNFSATFHCSYEKAWEKLMHPVITECTDFEEVVKYIDEQVSLGNGYKKTYDNT